MAPDGGLHSPAGSIQTGVFRLEGIVYNKTIKTAPSGAEEG